MEEQEYQQSLFSRLKSFFFESKRVFRITRKPTMEEYKGIVKVSAIGIAVIGVVGFIIQISWRLIA